MKSIIQNNKECFVCKTTKDLHEHHIIHGANRRNSEKYGLKVWLCGWHHNLGGKSSVHGNAEFDLKLKQMAEQYFEKTYKEENFIKIFGRSYK